MAIEEVFDYHDQPLLFTCRDSQGNLYLTLLIEENTWLYIELTDEKLEKMKRKEVDLYSAFTDMDRWYYATNACYALLFTASTIKPDDDHLPLPGEYLCKQ